MLARFSNLRLSVKLGAAIGLLGITILAVIVISLNQLAEQNTRLEVLSAGPVRQMSLAQNAVIELIKISRAARDLVIERTDAGKEAAIAEIAATKTDLAQTKVSLQSLPGAGQSERLTKFIEQADAYIAITDEMSALAKLNSKSRAFNLSATQGAESFEKVEKLVASMVADMTKVAEVERNVFVQRMVRTGQQLATELNRFYALEKDTVAEIDDKRLDVLSKELGDVADRISTLRGKIRDFASSQLAPPQLMEQLNGIDDGFEHWIEVDKEIQKFARENGDGRAQSIASTRGKAALEEAEAAAKSWLNETNDAMQADLAKARAEYVPPPPQNAR